ncbi:ribosomal protein L7/L12 [Streptomyces tricolor]|uniref:ribosomal protein L7/L12 n=1 Tax=Streptomyces tricolor TaxID=68277 RepID=UPI00381B340E
MTVEYLIAICDDIPHDVLLIAPGPDPLAVAQAVRRLSGLSLWRSKLLVDQTPVVILECIPEDAATLAATALREAGAKAEVRQQPQ